MKHRNNGDQVAEVLIALPIVGALLFGAFWLHSTVIDIDPASEVGRAVALVVTAAAWRAIIFVIDLLKKVANGEAAQ